jgi:NTP pyrophosphatase (non-canonical NTP hydrolase)
MTIKELQDHVKELRESQGWHDTSLEHRTLFLVTELGEVVQETLKLVELQAKHREADLKDIRDHLGMEIFDVMWNLVDLANLAGIDLEAAFTKKIDLNRNRQWKKPEREEKIDETPKIG